MSDRDRLLATGRTEIERVSYKQVEVKDFGVTTQLRDEIHARTNHYIKQSIPYFKNDELHTYIHPCPCFLGFARVVFFASLLGALRAFGYSKIIPVFFLVACLLFFLVYCQHEWVNVKTLPVVRKQLVLESQKDLNSFYEVTVTELNGVALQNYRAGVGFLQVAQGKIKLQAFNKKAMNEMSAAKFQSQLMVYLFMLASAYNCFFVVFY